MQLTWMPIKIDMCMKCFYWMTWTGMAIDATAIAAHYYTYASETWATHMRLHRRIEYASFPSEREREGKRERKKNRFFFLLGTSHSSCYRSSPSNDISINYIHIFCRSLKQYHLCLCLITIYYVAHASALFVRNLCVFISTTDESRRLAAIEWRWLSIAYS